VVTGLSAGLNTFPQRQKFDAGWKHRGNIPVTENITRSYRFSHRRLHPGIRDGTRLLPRFVSPAQHGSGTPAAFRVDRQQQRSKDERNDQTGLKLSDQALSKWEQNNNEMTAGIPLSG